MARIAVSHDSRARYPSGPGPFTAGVSYPELPSLDPSDQVNRVYALVRRALQEYGCDAPRSGGPGWNPLSEWIDPGARVFVLPNLVMHRRWWERRAQFAAQCTHGSVVRAVIDYVLLATGRGGRVAFGNAPVEASRFRRSAAEAGLLTLGQDYRLRGCPVEGPLDLRMEGKSADDDPTCRIDLGADSLLEELPQREGGAPMFRVGTCPPGFTASFHSPGSHVYLVHRELLEADVIVSVPKLKTHSKVGLTCALKGAVGTVTHKGCLAHFREGAPAQGGDEFPAPTWSARAASKLNDLAAHAGSGRAADRLRLATRFGVRIARSMPTGVIGGSWPGNDTCWRMALDLSRILLYARPDGTMSRTPLRRHLVVVDGIVAGEGDGPLHATPRQAGVVLFGADPPAVDAACAYVMGLDPLSIPLLAQSFARHAYPLTHSGLETLEIMLDGRPASVDELVALLGRPARVPGQWRGRCEYGRPGAARAQVPTMRAVPGGIEAGAGGSTGAEDEEARAARG